MIKLCLVGAMGRMGKALLSLLPDSMFDLTGAVDILQTDRPIFPGIHLSHNIKEAGKNCDLVIDFSCPESVEHSLDYCIKNHKAWLSGVTNLTETTHKKIQDAANFIPVFYAENMSLGITVLTQLVWQTAKKLKDFDVEIVEAHHRYKKDAPSGTALMLGRTVMESRGLTPESFCFNRKESARTSGQIGFSSLRGGSIPGTHTVYFLGDDEELSLTHRSQSRLIFAQGALRAASWLITQRPGLYSMNDFVKEVK